MDSRARRRTLLAMAVGSLGAGFMRVSLAAGSTKRVGVFARGGGIIDFWKKEFPKEFAANGFVEGRDFQIIWYELPVLPPGVEPGGAAVAALIGEMSRAGLDCVITHADPGTRFLQQSLGAIPVVTDVPDPIASGYAKTLARPGGNITGLHQGGAEVSLKLIELLRRLTANPPCVAWLGWSGFPEARKSFETAGLTLGVKVRSFVVTEGAAGVEALRREFAQLRAAGCLAAKVEVLHPETWNTINALALEHRIALSASRVQETGILAHYDIQRSPETRSSRRLPAIASRILRGEAAGNIPFEGPSRYMLILNAKTAESIRITIPSDVLLQADRVVQ